MFTDKKIKNILISSKVLSEQDFIKFQEAAKKENKDTLNYLFDNSITSQDIFYSACATVLNLPFVDLKNIKVRKDILTLIPETIAISHNIVAFDSDDKTIKIATSDPYDLEIFEFLEKSLNFKLSLNIATPDSIKEALKHYRKSLSAEFKYLTDDDKKINQKEDSKELEKLAKDIPITRIVDTLLEHAILEGASDIHIEPEEKHVLVRFRIDGILHGVMKFPKNIQPGIISRIKILSNLKVDEHRMPQDGRFKIASEKYRVSFRVSVIPTFDGEKIVMRLLNEKAKILSLEQLGLNSGVLQVVQRNIEKPHGMLLVTGPTGSGKTTTLYTILNILNTSEVNISTIEDPIEYRMKGVNQSQINPKIGFTFASGLRSLLRQDPDIIMVGEIRDQETAEIAIHSALTGHLVLSTLHTNDAPTTVPRLLEMGVPTFLLASTFNIIIAQRLLRKICQDCITSYNLDDKLIKELEKQIDMRLILETLEREKVISSAKSGLKELLFYRGKGCDKCKKTGYRGRVGIYEVLENDEALSDLVMHNAGAEKIREYAKTKNMLTMIEDGFIKAKNGITTIEEILRVTKQ